MSKVLELAEAVRRHVADGAMVALGCSLEQSIPFAAGHELIRQRRRDLTLVGPISDMLFDQLIGAGCVARTLNTWTGNVSEGLGHCFRRATEHGVPRPLEVRDHSNFSISLALWAAAWGSPYIPTRTLLGSDIAARNPDLELDGDVVRVHAVRPDVTILHVQRCDPDGRAHAWGPLGVAEEAGLAASRVILTAEELVDPAITLSDPNRILLPETKVCAVVHVPGGAHPSPVQGYWARDTAAFGEYHRRTRTEEGFGKWLQEEVLGVRDRAQYLSRFDVRALRVRRRLLSAPVDYADA
ncbi:MAG: CoA transferase subunit A [Candidatus Dormibacteraeota bacterium]|nr:CoA transferase subunit A [Candidatus Dormibacteraeota bacterium]